MKEDSQDTSNEALATNHIPIVAINPSNVPIEEPNSSGPNVKKIPSIPHIPILSTPAVKDLEPESPTTGIFKVPKQVLVAEKVSERESGPNTPNGTTASATPILNKTIISNLNKSLKAKQKIINAKEPHPKNISDIMTPQEELHTGGNGNESKGTKTAAKATTMAPTKSGVYLHSSNSVEEVLELNVPASQTQSPVVTPGGSQSGKIRKKISKQSSTKTDFFAAKLASAVDDVDSSDSDETFVYENNEVETQSVRSVEGALAAATAAATTAPEKSLLPSIPSSPRIPSSERNTEDITSIGIASSSIGTSSLPLTTSGTTVPVLTTTAATPPQSGVAITSIGNASGSNVGSTGPAGPRPVLGVHHSVSGASMTNPGQIPHTLTGQNSMSAIGTQSGGSGGTQSIISAPGNSSTQHSSSVSGTSGPAQVTHPSTSHGNGHGSVAPSISGSFNSRLHTQRSFSSYTYSQDERPRLLLENSSNDHPHSEQRDGDTTIHVDPTPSIDYEERSSYDEIDDDDEVSTEEDREYPPGEFTNQVPPPPKSTKNYKSSSSSLKLRSTTSKLFDKIGSQPRRYSIIPDNIDIEDFDDELMYYDSSIRFPYSTNGAATEALPLVGHKLPHYRSLNLNYPSKRQAKSKRYLSQQVRPANTPDAYPYQEGYYYDFDDFDEESQTEGPAATPRKDTNSTTRYLQQHPSNQFFRPEGKLPPSQRVNCIKSFFYTLVSIICILGVGFVMGFVLATTKDLTNVSITSIENPLVSVDELVFNVVVEALNPGWFTVSIQDVELDIFAKSGYLPDGNSNTVETVLLGTVYALESPMNFEGGFFKRDSISQIGDIKLLSPGKNLTGVSSNGTDPDNSKKWEMISKNPFDLIIRGVLRYDLPMSKGGKSVVVNKVGYVDPNISSWAKLPIGNIELVGTKHSRESAGDPERLDIVETESTEWFDDESTERIEIEDDSDTTLFLLSSIVTSETTNSEDSENSVDGSA